MYAKSLAICRQIGDQDGEAIALTNLGEVALALGDFTGAISLSEQALKITREIGEEWSISVCLNNLAEASFGMGRCDQSMKYLAEAIQIAWKIKALRSVARFAVTAGRCYQLQGCNQDAKELFEAALAHSSTEHEIREKATGWMEEMGMDDPPEPDDEKLGRAIQRFILADIM
jgi:tetratricopeptide (TPR) repeat protein